MGTQNSAISQEKGFLPLEGGLVVVNFLLYVHFLGYILSFMYAPTIVEKLGFAVLFILLSRCVYEIWRRKRTAPDMCISYFVTSLVLGVIFTGSLLASIGIVIASTTMAIPFCNSERNNRVFIFN